MALDDTEDQWITKYDENQCGNCHFSMNKEDQYCRSCGTKRGEGKFEPYKNVTKFMYAEKIRERKHICQQCGYKWKTTRMEDCEKFCPKCGGPAPVVNDKDIIKKKSLRVPKTEWDNLILEFFLPYRLVKRMFFCAIAVGIIILIHNYM